MTCICIYVEYLYSRSRVLSFRSFRVLKGFARSSRPPSYFKEWVDERLTRFLKSSQCIGRALAFRDHRCDSPEGEGKKTRYGKHLSLELPDTDGSLHGIYAVPVRHFLISPRPCNREKVCGALVDAHLDADYLAIRVFKGWCLRGFFRTYRATWAGLKGGLIQFVNSWNAKCDAGKTRWSRSLARRGRGREFQWLENGTENQNCVTINRFRNKSETLLHCRRLKKRKEGKRTFERKYGIGVSRKEHSVWKIFRFW